MIKKTIALFALPFSVLLVAGIGPLAWADGGHGHGGDAIGQPGSEAEVDRVVAVTLLDNRFEPDTLTVKEGETIKFELDNQGRLLHEFNIGTQAMHQDHQQEMMEMMRSGMLTPMGINKAGKGESMMQHDDPNSVLLEPGEKGSLIWTFSADAELQFACNVPGHYQAGMWAPIEVGH